MTGLYQFLLATVLIAAMILVRVFANRYRLRQRLDCGHVPGQCGRSGDSGGNEARRSACHAP